jgi:glucuronosyltransferase
MATHVDISLLLLFFQVCSCTSIQSGVQRGVSKSSLLDDVQGLNVVLLTLPESGNLAPVLALGGELVRRGHSVTLITTTKIEGNFSNRTIEQAERVGVTYKSAGNSLFLLNEIAKKSVKDVWTILSTFTRVMPQEQGAIMAFVDEYLKKGTVDIVVSNELLQPVVACINSAYKVPVIALGTSLQYQMYTYPSWPWPGVLAGASSSDNLNFMQRFRNTFEYYLGNLVFRYGMIMSIMGAIQHYCPDATLQYASSVTSIHIPHIVQSAIGFEYPRTISPLTSYVGPILSNSPDQIPEDMMSWLDKKDERQVIYISMGSFLVLGRKEIEIILNAVLATHYSAVWALRTKNDDDLTGISIDGSRIYITEWAPQLAILQHRSIGMAILHGGSNGLHEALYNGIPPIVLPVAGDQYANAGRVQYQYLGIHIPTSNLSEASLIDAINGITEGTYRGNVERLRKSFVAGGGVQRAADLVEFYEAVGYSHLIPAYAKYNWSWVQYYNVDVYLFLGFVIVALGSILLFCCCDILSLCRRVCDIQKEKVD